MPVKIHRLLVLLFALATVGAGLAQSGGGYDLSWHLVSAGGGGAVGGHYALPASIGQPAVGALAGGSYTLRAGFWQSFAPATGTPTPTATSTATATNSPTATHTPTPTATATPAERVHLPLVLRNYGDHSETRTPGLGNQGVSSSATAGALLVVNTTDDTDDGACDAGHCSLREAIDAANANAGPDTIAFDIPPSDPGYDAGGWWTIRPARTLPLDDGGTTIDGTTQTANRGDANPLGPEIELDGSLNSGWGFDIWTANNVIRGLTINRFPAEAIRLDRDGAANNRIVGNYLGTDPTGTEDRGNAWGIYIYRGAHDNTIGGAAPEDRNLVSGNDQAGIGLISAGADDNSIVGNLIGTNAQGSQALPNTYDGILIIFGGQRNVIGPGNVIAFNGRIGVRVNSSNTLSNTITTNSIYRNTRKGIFLEDGGNANLAAPVIVAVSVTTVQGTACAGCRVEIFSDLEDEGAVYEGFTTADGAGNWVFTKPDGLAGPNVTATATDGAGNTSEFSAPVPIAGTATPTATSTPTGTPSPTPTASPTPTPTATVGAPAALIVNSTDDADDGICDAGHCSLHEAVWLARPGDTIAFNIPPSDPGYDAAVGVWTVRPAARYGLPGGVTIDGTTQTANRGDTNPFGPEIEVDGSGHTSDFDCFRLRSDDNVLRGLVINRCGSNGVWVEGSYNVVAGNYIGTDATGTQALPVNLHGVLVIRAQNNTIGGPAPADRNVIVANENRSGVSISDDTSQSNQILGNYIGTDRTGTLALGKGSTGIMIHANAHDNLIGSGNVISGNRWGVWIQQGASDNTVRDNYVGTEVTGTAPLGNTGLGVVLGDGAQDNHVGPGNAIAYNGRDGVWVEDADSVGNTITRNSIHSNGGLGISNVDGGNAELAPPVIATISGGQVSGTACPGCTVEVFSDFEDEGRTFEGATVADAAGNWSLHASPAGPNVTATATDGAGNTSEFSAPVVVLHNRVYLPLVRR